MILVTGGAGFIGGNYLWKITKELEYKPNYTLEQGIQKTLPWYGETK